MFEFLDALSLLARGGGGGSGGGSSSGGGGGGVLVLFYFLGYFPSYYLGKIVKKLLSRTPELIVSATFATLASIVILGIGLYGGFFGVFITGIIVFGIWSGWNAAFWGVWEKLKKRSEKIKKSLHFAAKRDAAWNADSLLSYAKTTFNQYQLDWSTTNIRSMEQYLTPRYLEHVTMLMRTLYELGRTNAMSDVTIEHALITDMMDERRNGRDTFTVSFQASATDELISDLDGRVLFTDKTTFTEDWTFFRSGNTWLLDHIDQATANPSTKQLSLKRFAEQYGMYYSIDMGWLFLPDSGLLFKDGKFGKSDINNHVVGEFNGHLVQLYTYSSDGYSHARDKTGHHFPQLVAQINLPKSYEGILIRRDKSFAQRLIDSPVLSDYKKFEFEWPDFNKRYDVYATDADRLAAFELLNPSFMAYLYDTDAGVSIEVAGSIVYLYKDASQASLDDYQNMMTILTKAFKELQL